jgi:hypothetical protein
VVSVFSDSRFSAHRRYSERTEPDSPSRSAAGGNAMTLRSCGSTTGWRRILARTTGDEALMNTTRLIAIALIVAGILGLVYGGFSYTKDTTAVKLGPLELSVKQKETVNVPMWAGIGAILAGGLLLVLGGKKG